MAPKDADKNADARRSLHELMHQEQSSYEVASGHRLSSLERESGIREVEATRIEAAEREIGFRERTVRTLGDGASESSYVQRTRRATPSPTEGTLEAIKGVDPEGPAASTTTPGGEEVGPLAGQQTVTDAVPERRSSRKKASRSKESRRKQKDKTRKYLATDAAMRQRGDSLLDEGEVAGRDTVEPHEADGKPTEAAEGESFAKGLEKDRVKGLAKELDEGEVVEAASKKGKPRRGAARLARATDIAGRTLKDYEKLREGAQESEADPEATSEMVDKASKRAARDMVHRLSDKSPKARLDRKTVKRLERSGASLSGIERRLEAEATRRKLETSRAARLRKATVGVRNAASYRTVRGGVVAGTSLRVRIRAALQEFVSRFIAPSFVPIVAMLMIGLGFVLAIALFALLPGVEESLGTTDYTGGNQTVVEAAWKMYNGTSTYLYGGGRDKIHGSDPNFDTDCSGLVAWCYWQAGVEAPSQSADYPSDSAFEVVDKSKAKPGDVLWWSSPRHVALYIGGDQTIEHCDPSHTYGGRVQLCEGKLATCERVYHYKAWTGVVRSSTEGNRIVSTAMTRLKVPINYDQGDRFHWDRQMDCSGFTYLTYKKCGYDIPANQHGSNYSQYATVRNKGNMKYTVDELVPGDLVFFGSESDVAAMKRDPKVDTRTPGHVAIYVGDGKCIECRPTPSSYDVVVEPVLAPGSRSWRTFLGGGSPL